MLLSFMAFMLVERDFWSNLAPWSCASERFVPAAKSAPTVPPSPASGDFTRSRPSNHQTTSMTPRTTSPTAPTRQLVRPTGSSNSCIYKHCPFAAL
ncbi:hypothetical protein J3459_014776 [Metarhizium acridum]|nr:hypothetical protein J3459_014776 [Metarhizium acridum]